MSQIVEYRSYTEERGERIERLEEIYESADTVRGHNPKTETEDTNTKTQHTANPEAETELLSTISNNMTIDELQVIYIKLDKERDQLQTRYTSMAEERDQLRKKTNKPENMFPELVDIVRLGGKYFRTSIYYISAEKKSWGQSRLDCIKRGADLVIIDSQEEKDFITEQLGNKSQALVGLKSKDTDEEWKWVDGTALNTGYWKIPSKRNNVGNISGGQNWVVTPWDHVEWWVCEIKIFE